MIYYDLLDFQSSQKIGSIYFEVFKDLGLSKTLR